MRVKDAILEVLRWKNVGDTISLIDMTQKVGDLLGKYVTDGTVSRYLRWFNEGKFDKDMVVRYEVVRHGRYRIIKKEDWKANLIKEYRESLFV